MAKKMPEIKEDAAETKAIKTEFSVKSPKKANAGARMTSELSKPEAPAEAASVDTAQTKKKVKKTKKVSDKPNIFKRMWKGIKGVISELKKVTWPKGKDVVKSTGVVLVIVVAFFIVLFGIDYVLAGLLKLIVAGEWAFIFI